MKSFSIIMLLLCILSCKSKNSGITIIDDEQEQVQEQNKTYKGSASVTQGLATTTTNNLFSQGQRVAGLGSITATDNSVWSVPADVNYTDTTFPFALDLNNRYGAQHETTAAALAAFDDNDIVEIDASGEVFTAFIFADNYFELYINGTPVGKDAVPFTEFNSHLVKFKVSKPFTIAMKLVDWEENLGLGSEDQATAYHPGDGGMIAVLMDENEAVVAGTNNQWKAQTFYTAPIEDLACPTESGTTRSSANCSTADAITGSNFYALHWEIPADWAATSFDDSSWPAATEYTSSELGMDNKTAYTSYLNVFDKAEFIWSTNVILDNEVIVRHSVE